jgi:signal transduction histidine kinase
VTENLISSVVAEEVSHVVNEALANVYRHAKASHVTVFAQTRGHTFEMTIRDDGIGFDVARALRRDIRKRSFGLVSMHERIARVNGTLELRSQAGEGTRVRLAVPLGRGTSRRRT